MAALDAFPTFPLLLAEAVAVAGKERTDKDEVTAMTVAAVKNFMIAIAVIC